MFKAANIIEGWKNLLIPNSEVEKIAINRANICSICINSTPQAVFKLKIKDRIEKITGFGCSICSCPLSSKLRVPFEICPDERWGIYSDDKNSVSQTLIMKKRHQQQLGDIACLAAEIAYIKKISMPVVENAHEALMLIFEQTRMLNKNIDLNSRPRLTPPKNVVTETPEKDYSGINKRKIKKIASFIIDEMLGATSINQEYENLSVKIIDHIKKIQSSLE